MKHYIENSRFLEGVTEIASQIVHAQFGGSEGEKADNGDIKYTEEAQDFFNLVLEDVESIINNKLGVHSAIELEGGSSEN